MRERINNGLQACNFYYHADNKVVGNRTYKALYDYGWTYKKIIPSIHMPKWAARVWLEVTGVRFEMVQDISEKDATKEGAKLRWAHEIQSVQGNDYFYRLTARIQFKKLWDSINEKRGYGWCKNPWVFMYSFRRIEQ